MEKKTRILAIGDLHGDSGLAKKLAKKAKDENVDLVILAGDLTLAEISTKNLIGPFVKEKKQVLIIPGNHESVATADFLAELYGAKNIHGYAFSKDNLGIFGAGGADIGPNRISESEIFNLLKKGHDSVKNQEKQIMVTHMHHEGSKSEISGFEGSKAIRKAVNEFKPDFLISAHIHEAGGLSEKVGKTRIINVARKEKIFEI